MLEHNMLYQCEPFVFEVQDYQAPTFLIWTYKLTKLDNLMAMIWMAVSVFGTLDIDTIQIPDSAEASRTCTLIPQKRLVNYKQNYT